MKYNRLIISIILLVISMSPFSTAFAKSNLNISSVELIDFIERPEMGVTQKKVVDLVWHSLKQALKQNTHLTENDLLDAADDVTKYLRDKGFKFATAHLPEQNLSSGRLKIAIIEGKLGDIQCPGEEREYACASIRSAFSDLLGQPIYEPEFTKRLNQLRLDPRIDLFGYFSRGSKLGETRVNFKVKKFQRWQFSVSADNFGNPATGKNRLNLKSSLFSPLDRFDTLMAGLSLSKGDDGSEVSTYGYIAYDLPLWNLSNRISLFLANNLFDVGGDFTTLELEGDSRVAVIEYKYDWGDRFLQQSIGVAAQYIETDYKSAFNSPSLEPDEDETAGKISWQFSSFSTSGLSNFNSRISYVGGQYTSNQFTEKRDFAKLELSFSAQTLFAPKSRLANQWRLLINGQYAEKPLPNAEQRSLSGINGVRAIEAGYFSGDRLAYSAVELRFPRFFGDGLFGEWLLGESEAIRIQPLIFIEGAYGEKLQGNRVYDRTHASGVGIGLEFSSNQTFFGRVYVMDLLESYSLSNTAAEKMSVLAELGFSF